MLKTQNSDGEKIQNPNSKIQNQTLRVLLWDIDGTLMQSTRAGAFKEYFAPAMREVYGSSGSLAEMSVSGMTDSQIAYEALQGEGFSTEKVFSKIDEFMVKLGEGMTRFVSEQKEPYRLLDGAREILEETGKNPQFINAILTGNFTVGAEIKLKHFDLWKYFENQPNTFGEISHDRRKLAGTAAKNIKKFLQVELNHDQFIVIGDTPNDIACARSLGAKMISVATGRNHPMSELAEYKPDVLLENLSDTKKVLQILETL
jgi:phosphoglycolate phosphatase-like HAD superfamily hydrolase